MARHVRTLGYHLHQASGQAVVYFDRKEHYLGAYDSPESRAEYDRLLALWLKNSRKLPPDALEPVSPHSTSPTADADPPAPAEMTINELVLA